MSARSEPPSGGVLLSFDEALYLLVVLEDARHALIGSGRLALVVEVEGWVRELHRRLGLVDPEGGVDDR